MKSLIIGIDGGDERLFRELKLSNLIKLFDSFNRIDLTENLWDRGWASILSGKGGADTGAFYNKPKLDGGYGFTQSFGTKNYQSNSNITPLWEIVEKAGLVGGFMNIPTTMPAPKNESGFFVSGAGGGLGGLSKFEIPQQACNSDSLVQELKDMGYIMDIRFISSEIFDQDVLIQSLIDMTKTRTECFIQLAKNKNIEFGFIAFMSTSRIQNLAMSEIKDLIAHDLIPQNSFQTGIYELYKTLDNCVEKLIADLNPDFTTITSDHGATNYKYSINIDEFLIQEKYFFRNRSILSLAKRIAKQFYKSIVSSAKRKRMSKNIPSGLRNKDLDRIKTKAFGARYVSGIYINDNRFGGSIVSEKETENISSEIIDKINSSELFKEYKITAFPYRSKFEKSSLTDLLPDIWINKPDEMFFEGKGKLIQENNASITSLSLVDKDMYTGLKGSKPLFFTNDPEVTKIDFVNPNLTMVYHFLKRQLTK